MQDDIWAPLVRKLTAYGELPEQAIAAIRKLPYHLKNAAPGEAVVREGDKPQSSVLVLKGMLFRHKMVADGKRQILSFHIAGDMPDLQSLFLTTMDHSLAAAGHASLMMIPHEPILRLNDQHPEVGKALWQDTLIDGAIFREWISNNGRRRAVQRVAHLLCELFLRAKAVGLTNGNAYSVPLTQQHLSDAAGLSMVHLNRSLQDLRRRKLLQLTKTELTILDWTKLKDVADFDESYLHLHAAAGA